MPLTCEEKVLSNDYADLIMDYTVPDDIAQLLPYDYCIQGVDEQFKIVHIRRQDLPPFSVSTFIYRFIPNMYTLMQDAFDPDSLAQSGILRTQRPPLNLTGQGVVMAFIDTGIRYDEPVFQNPDGSTRILAIWDQTVQDGPAPEGFLYGTEYTREDINRSLSTGEPLATRDTNGHGTALASVAAGSVLEGGAAFQGAAPQCDIVVVKLKECKPFLRQFYLIKEDAPAYQETDIMLAVKYVQSFTRMFMRPVVICLGLGTNMGDHAGNTALDVYLNKASARRSQAVVVCGGSEGNAAHHFSEILSQNDSVDGVSSVDAEIRVGEGNRGFIMELWGNIPAVFVASIRSPGGEIIPRFRLRVGETQTYTFIYEPTRITVDSILVEEGSGDELLFFRFEDPTPGVWTVQVSTVGRADNALFHMWLPVTQFLTADTYFLRPSPFVTLTEPSLAQDVLTTSTYNSFNNSFYINSGRGYARGGRVKPDISAPGVDISTILGKRTGSSLAAALTAGGVAQFMEWAIVRRNNDIVEGKEIKNYFIRGAQRDPTLSYPNREWGFGRMDVSGIFEQLVNI